MILDVLRREHRNIEELLRVLEQELDLFDRAERPDYEVIKAVIAYFEVYPATYHHPQEDILFEKLKARDPAAAATIGDLAAEHHSGAERLRRVARAIEGVLMDREYLRRSISEIIRDFIVQQRRHIAMEELEFFPAALKALYPEDWEEIASRLIDRKDPLFSDSVERSFDDVRRRILQLENEALAERA